MQNNISAKVLRRASVPTRIICIGERKRTYLTNRTYVVLVISHLKNKQKTSINRYKVYTCFTEWEFDNVFVFFTGNACLKIKVNEVFLKSVSYCTRHKKYIIRNLNSLYAVIYETMNGILPKIERIIDKVLKTAYITVAHGLNKNTMATSIKQVVCYDQ